MEFIFKASVTHFSLAGDYENSKQSAVNTMGFKVATAQPQPFNVKR